MQLYVCCLHVSFLIHICEQVVHGGLRRTIAPAAHQSRLQTISEAVLVSCCILGQLMKTAQPAEQRSVSKPPEGCCQVWLVHKQRYCGWPAKAGAGVCRNHLYHSSNADQELVTCPYHPLQ